MNLIKIKKTIALGVMICATGLTHVAVTLGLSSDDNLRVPELPPVCGTINVPAGNRLVHRTYALGVQIYKWNGTAWDFVAPEANLYSSRRFRGKVGTHYAGPTWESESGSYVIGRRVQGCDPDPTAISWLLLEDVESDGPGIYKDVTYIQRVNTRGGLKPATPGSYVGEEVRMPYTTEYYFYKERGH